MGDTQTQRVYQMIDSLTDTMSWAELAKELDKHAAQLDRHAGQSSETIEMDDFVKALRDKAGKS